jgi:hypothetical protein
LCIMYFACNEKGILEYLFLQIIQAAEEIGTKNLHSFVITSDEL